VTLVNASVVRFFVTCEADEFAALAAKKP